MGLPFQLQGDEQVITLVRRHPLYIYPKLLGLAFVGVAPIALAWWGISAAGEQADPLRPFLLPAAVVWAAIWLVIGYFTWYRHQNDIWVLTNQRLIDSFKRHWFHHDMSSADLVNVEDMSIQREGLLETMFNYGDVRCETAGTAGSFVLAAIPDPSGMLARLDAARDEARRELYAGRG